MFLEKRIYQGSGGKAMLRLPGSVSSWRWKRRRTLEKPSHEAARDFVRQLEFLI